MHSNLKPVVFGIVCGTVLSVSSVTHAQDSVALTPGNSDALPAHLTPQVTRYVLDMRPLTTSWGNSFLIGPVLKATLDYDPMFPTQIVGASALSSNQRTNVVIPLSSYSVWNTPGQGVNPTENAVAPTINVAAYDRQFAIGMSDLSSTATNVVTAVVGQDSADPDRLYVTRIQTMVSRTVPGDADSSTLSLGAVDADGNTAIRADNFNTASALSISGENVLEVNVAARNTGTANPLFNFGAGNQAADAGATSYLINNEITTTNTPALAPAALAGTPLSIILDFAGKYRADGAAGVTTHLGAGLSGHRGNPSYTIQKIGAGIGTVASLARSTSSTLVDAINIFEINAAGAVLSNAVATLPSPITATDGFTANVADDAQFLQYLSQTSFRGGNGQVAIARVGSEMRVAATATDPAQGEFIAVASFTSPNPTWNVAAHIGQSVLDGENGSPIGVIAAGNPATFSAPGMDYAGNVYFVAWFDPTVGSPRSALIKAVNTAGGYKLELILESGDSFNGANSGRTYTIEEIILSDSDSVASGSFFSGNVLQPRIPGSPPLMANSSDAVGGLLVGARITYNNAGTPEPYQALLFLSPQAVPTGCDGDADGNQMVNVNDISYVVFRLGTNPGACGEGDVDGNGSVNVNDISYVVFRLGSCVPTGPCL